MLTETFRFDVVLLITIRSLINGSFWLDCFDRNKIQLKQMDLATTR